AILASGLAGGLAGDSTQSAAYAAQTGKTTVENNALASRNIGDCRTMSPEACGKARELSQKILDKGLPSVEDMRDKLSACTDDGCKKSIWSEYRRASDATIDTLKQMGLNGELSREELAFINHELGRELGFAGRVEDDKLGMSEYMSWLNGGTGPLSGFFNTELREKELVAKGLTKADAVQYVKEEQRNLMLVEAAAGVIGSKSSNKINASSEKTAVSNEGLKGGAARAQMYAKNWPSGNLDKAIEKFAGSNPTVTTTEKGKRIYTNPKTGVQVVEDTNGSYFRIYDPSISGKRSYLSLDGSVPNNKTLDNGKQAGRTQSEYNEVTHFKIDKDL
ncbi:VENN motif pre-toxin domain-containing protein, partial [Siccibacter turicensis]|uniref:VENN motif pre-toxin domain-containing protein n=1 Tax=Siccibacter turicensis TaxID=357233 RepID=UPI002A6A02F7